MVIDSQELFFWFMCLVFVAYIVAWFVTIRPRFTEAAIDRALLFLIGWFLIGWFPIGGIGLGVGLLLNHFTGETNWTTGSTLTGMALSYPIGLLTYHLYLKRL